MIKRFRIIAKTLHNLEDVLAEEIAALGGEDIEIGRRMVSFTGDKRLLYQANLCLRTALRVLVPKLTFKASNPDALYEVLRGFDWSELMTSRQTFSIDTTVYSDHFSHSKYVSYRTKDAIVDYWREKTGDRPSVSLTNPNIYINIHIAHDEVTLSLDSSGESLHKRGYRLVQTDAPINEVLAAGILLKAGWRGETDLIDPMCGSGTFLIEAALIARNIAPGLTRNSFAFMNWQNYDPHLYEELFYDESRERDFEHRIYGSDVLPNAVKIAQKNISRAGVGRDITLEVMPFESRPAPEQPALIVMNPPYGERLKLQSPKSLYEMIGERLKHHYQGSTAWIIAYRPEHFDGIGLKHGLRLDLMNGALECELRSYQLFAGKHKDFKTRHQAERSAESTLGKPREQRESRSPRRDDKTQRPRHTEGKRSERSRDFRGQGREREGFHSKSRTPRDKDRAFFARGERAKASAKPREGEHSTRSPRRPSREMEQAPRDRFLRRDAEGGVYRKASARRQYQVFRSDED